MESPPIFQLKDLTYLCVNRLKQLGVTSVNKTRLKEQLLYYMPEIETNKQGRNILK